MAGSDDQKGKSQDSERQSTDAIEIESGWESIPPPEPAPQGGGGAARLPRVIVQAPVVNRGPQAPAPRPPPIKPPAAPTFSAPPPTITAAGTAPSPPAAAPARPPPLVPPGARRMPSSPAISLPASPPPRAPSPPSPPSPPLPSPAAPAASAVRSAPSFASSPAADAAASLPPPLPGELAPPPDVLDEPLPPPEAPPIADELRARAERLAKSDPVGSARALVELGIHEERINHDRKAARLCYQNARSRVRSLEPALMRLRRLCSGKAELATALPIIDDELLVAQGEVPRADLLAERARICELLGKTADSKASYAEALRLVPMHAASLRGLEIVLRKEHARGTAKTVASELAVHLERLAEAYVGGADRNDGDALLSAWILVERATVVDRRLNDAQLARAALERAVSYVPQPGPVRDALTRHLVLHNDLVALAESLAVEADQEADHDRASRLLYTAARLLADKLDEMQDAIKRLTQAQTRAPGTTNTAQRVLSELIRLLELTSEHEGAADMRQRRLGLLADTDAVVHEHVRLSELYDALGKADRSAAHAARALEIDPEAPGIREKLDRALQRLGRHEDRLRAWASVADSANRSAALRVAALMRAADIAERNLRRREEAIALLRSAWAIDPGNTAVFDTLSVLLSPASRDPDSDPRGVRARIDLYTQAAQATTDPARRIGLLEKLVSIWEDELYQPARAIDELEKILAIDPGRRTAILALQRNAARANDAQRLARALQAEADLTADRALQRKLLLQAADVVSTRLGDRDRALFLVDRALSVDPSDVEALRTRQRIDERLGRHEEARKSLVRLIAVEEKTGNPFPLWLELAVLDEQRLKRPRDAVEAYRQAARHRNAHPLPRIEIARLLREIGDYAKLVEALMGLAANATDANDYARLLFEAAEIQEIKLGNDDAALTTLTQADAHLPADRHDPAILEALERIYIRRSATAELGALYTRWLERTPPASVDHALRIALATVLAESDRKQAIDILAGLVGVVPGHIPALRLLEQLYRLAGAHSPLAAVLRASAEVVQSRVARVGLMWEVVAMEDELGASVALEALDRLVSDAPTDTGALDAIVRIAGRLVEGMGIHPTVLAVRNKLVAALRARRELASDVISRSMLQIEEAIFAEARIQEDPTLLRVARDAYWEALALWPDSLIAARGLERMARAIGDRASAIAANVALAKLSDNPREKALHFVRAAELNAEDGNRDAQMRALDLYEQALTADADSAPSVQNLARMLQNDPGRLIDRLSDALARARVRAQIVLIGTEIGQATLRHKEALANAPEPGHGIAAMRRVLSVVPDDIPSLILMARLLVAQRIWSEARDTLLRVIHFAAREQDQLIAAQFMLADLYEGPLDNLEAAEQCLHAILAIDPKSRKALEKLVQIATTRGEGALVIQTLGRLAELAPDPSARIDTDMRLAEACRKEGDTASMVRALCDALATMPNDPRPAAAFARLYRLDTNDGAAGYVKAMQQTVDIANARRLPVDSRWLMSMGLLEATVLLRPREGVVHLQQAATLPGAPPDVRTALGRGLEAANRNSEAIAVLREVLTTDAETIARVVDLGPALGALDAALAKEGRVEERLSVEEARGCLGELLPERMSWLRTRRLPPDAPHANSLMGPELARLLVPEAKCPMIDVAVAISPITAKVLRFELGNLGISSRDRIGPRDAHPTRVLADRIARALGLENFELYLTPTWKGAARAYPGDPPIIVGSSSFAELPEPEQMFGLARLLVRCALGFSWIDELNVDAADGLLLASLRSVNPSFGGDLGTVREHALQSFLVPVQKAIGRKQRKLLEEIAPNAGAAYDPRALNIGVRRSEYRIAYLVTGDLIASVDYLRRYDREIGRSAEDPRVLLQHPVTNELLRYTMSAESFAERRRIGTAALVNK